MVLVSWGRAMIKTQTLQSDIEHFVSPVLSQDKILAIQKFENLHLSEQQLGFITNLAAQELSNGLVQLSETYGPKLVLLLKRYLSQGLNVELVDANEQVVSNELVAQLRLFLQKVVYAQLCIPIQKNNQRSIADGSKIAFGIRSIVQVVVDTNQTVSTDNARIYCENTGLYEPLDQCFGSFWTVLMTKILGIHINQNIENEILTSLVRIAERFDFRRFNSTFVGIGNGDLDLDSFEIVASSASHFITYRLPVSPNQKNINVTPAWQQWLNTQWSGDDETQNFLLEWTAVQILPQSVGQFVLFYNDGSGGKTVWMNVVRNGLLGPENVATVTADKFRHNFGPSMLLRSDRTMKLANLVDESPRDFDMSFLKKVADPLSYLTIDIKNRQSITCSLAIKMTFATNSLDLGIDGESNYGTFRKLALVYFPKRILPSEQDSTIEQRMIDEMDDMAGLLLHILRKMRDRKSFQPIESASMLTWKNDFFNQYGNSPMSIVSKFIDERVTIDAEKLANSRQIKACFDEYIQVNNLEKGRFNSDQLFWKEFKRVMREKGYNPVSRKSNSIRIYDGLSVLTTEELNASVNE